MSPIAETSLVAGHEVRKNLGGLKGVVLLLLSVLGGAAAAFIVTAYVRAEGGAVPPAEEEAMIAALTRDAALAHALVQAPRALIMLLMPSVWLAPALVWLAGFDGISGDLQHRAVRYIAVRTRRVSYYLGKLVGLWLSLVVITLALHVTMWIIVVARGSPAGVTLAWGLRMWMVTLPITAAWCGIAVFSGSLLRAPVSSLLVIGLVFFAVFLLGWVAPHAIAGPRPIPDVPQAHALSFFYPNTYDVFLLSPRGDRTAIGLIACAAFVVLPTALGAWVFQRRDV